MKRSQAAKLLNVSPQTINNYKNKGLIGARKLPSGQYDYSDNDVFDILNDHQQRKTIIYARVSTGKQKDHLETQLNDLNQFCISKGWAVDETISEVASGLTFDKRKSFYRLLDEIESNKVKRIVITHKDRLSRVSFDVFKHLFNKHGCDIIVLSDIIEEKTDQEEIFEEIISLLHCFSTRMYSKRRKGFKKVLDETKANTQLDTVKQRYTARSENNEH